MNGIRLLIGLGNPGKVYAATRHNIGDMVVKRFEDKFTDNKLILKDESASPPVIYRALSFMNQTGFAVKRLISEHNLEPRQMLVICDDFDLALGQLRIRRKGSAGSHNGLKSIINELGTQEFPRLRVGIGPLPPDADPAGFVLSGFTRKEEKQVKEITELAADAIQMILANGIDAAMNTFNQPNETKTR